LGLHAYIIISLAYNVIFLKNKIKINKNPSWCWWLTPSYSGGRDQEDQGSKPEVVHESLS
jgi:hypothetical protein